MAVETELKLSIAPSEMRRLKRHPLLAGLSAGRAVTRNLTNIYYDTPALDLRKRAMALRLRRSGGRWLQTLKGGGGANAGLHRRDEWETPAPGGVLDFAALEAAGAPVLPAALRAKLRPVFSTDFSRNMRLLKYRDAEIELCMDSGEIHAGKKRRPISELELELKAGPPQRLFELALDLLDIVPVAVEQVSKAAYGYGLLQAERLAVARMHLPELPKTLGMPQALRAIAVSCLVHVEANVPGMIRNLDEEYLHQVRVGLRRLRVVLALAESWRADAALRGLRKDAGELCAAFGRLREWDVFLTQTLAGGGADVRALRRAGEAQRAQRRAELESRLVSRDYQRFLLRFGAWLHGDYWDEISVGKKNDLAGFATRELQRRTEQAQRRGRHFARADTAQLHALRIACKKLRYAAEMFGALFDAAAHKRYLSALSQLQDELGALNDIAVASGLLDELESGGARVQAVAQVRSHLEQEWMKRHVAARQAWRRFRARPVFW